MKQFILFFLMTSLVFAGASAQQKKPIATIDVLKVHKEFEKEARFFYERNWKAFRDEALKLNYISGYQLMISAPDSLGYLHITLLTEYADSASFAKVEEHFRPIMKKISPNGPVLLNDVKIREKFQYITGSEGVILFRKRKK